MKQGNYHLFKGWIVPLTLVLLMFVNGGCSKDNYAEQSAQSADPNAGKRAYTTACGTCHGFNAEGMPGLGKDLRTSDMVRESSAEMLVAFFKEGRPANDPLNTTGIAMPPKGGHAELTDQDLYDIVAFLKQLSLQ